MIGQIWSDLLTLLGIALLAVLFLALLSPLESLGWYAGWRQRRTYTRRTPVDLADGAAADAAGETPEASHYVVFLSGIGDPSAQWHYPEETEFLRRLREALPDAAVISDLFAYSVTSTDVGAASRRAPVSKMWGGIEKSVRQNQYAPVGALINLRNLFQVTVSVDHRYGPFFNLGQAENVRDALLAYGYRPGSARPVTLIGYSGGGQVSLGLAAYLTRMLGAPVTVLSIGGVMSSEPSCLQVEHLYHLWGEKDPIQSIGDLAFAGRWPISAKSPWNQALREGKITRIAMGPVAHNGSGGYFGPLILSDGRASIDHTLEVVLPIITGDTAALEQILNRPPLQTLQSPGTPAPSAPASAPGAPGETTPAGTTPAGTTPAADSIERKTE